MTLQIQNLGRRVGQQWIVRHLNLQVDDGECVALVGPSGCGKSSTLRLIAGLDAVSEGEIFFDQTKVTHAMAAQRAVGMVFQRANPFPKSIFDNVAYGPRIHGLVDTKTDLNNLVEASLTKSGLWNEVKDRLNEPGTGLSGGQQQRLCIARAIAVEPEVILMDEPCSALDPIATARIEELIDELRQNYTIVMVTHSMQQAARVSQRTAFFHLGNLEETGETEQIFTTPREKRTRDYITGRIG